jgi:glycerophosphoryl diester phosphodiesterase
MARPGWRCWLLALLAAPALHCASAPPAPIGPAAVPEGVLIAHALGAVEDTIYTNSREAWQRNLARGYRWFEVDLALTADGDLVCFHPDLENKIALDTLIRRTDTAAFLSHCFEERFTLMTFAELLRHLAAHPRAHLVIDTKWWTPGIAAALVRELQAAPRRVRRQIVPQLYRPWNVVLLRQVEARLGPFPAVIFTLYQIRISDEDVVAFAAREGIAAVAASTTRFDPGLAQRLHRIGVKVLVHTVDDPADIQRFSAQGADGFFTDSYLPGR